MTLLKAERQSDLWQPDEAASREDHLLILAVFAIITLLSFARPPIKEPKELLLEFLHLVEREVEHNVLADLMICPLLWKVSNSAKVSHVGIRV